MDFLKNKEQVINDRLSSIHEQVFKTGDVYKVKTTIDIPKSVINAFVSKAKKENSVDPRENWSDTDLAELFVAYLAANFINVESLPVNAILGTADKTEGEANGEVQPEEVEAPIAPEGTDVEIEDVQPITDVTVETPDEEFPSGEIQA